MTNKISRIQEKKLLLAVNDPSSREVLLIQGARQVGKTTLVEKVLESISPVYALNLERDTDALRAIDRTQSFEEFHRYLQLRFNTQNFDQKGAVLFIDEAQESEKIGSYVRFMKEEWQQLRVILSGSSMNRIFRQNARIPVGRYRPWLVTPVVFDEFLMSGLQESLKGFYREFSKNPREGVIDGLIHEAFLTELDQYFLVGGLPSVVTSFWQDEDYVARRRFIYDSQEDDFVRKSSLADRSFFGLGLKGVANFLGMPSKYSHVHETKVKAEGILSEQIAWNLIIEIEQKGMSSTTSHLPKRYLYDIGMAQDLRDMPFPKLSLVATKNPALRTQLGGLFENALLIFILSEQTYLGNLSGWKKAGSESSEVDFIWRYRNRCIPLECKASQKISMKHWSGLKAYLETSEQSLGILISAAPFKVIRSKKYVLVNLPLYLASGANILRCAELFDAG